MVEFIFIFIGALTMQLFYIVANWLQYRKVDYVNYFLYTFILLIYFLIIYQTVIFKTVEDGKTYTFLRFFLRPLAFFIYAFYFSFAIKFIETKTIYQSVHRKIVWIKNSCFGMGVFFMLINLFSQDTPESNILYLILSLVLFAFTLWLIILVWKRKNPVSIFLLRGAVSVAIGAFISNLISILFHSNASFYFEGYLIPLHIGIIIEVFFFNLGLTYKSRMYEQNMIASQQLLIEQLEQTNIYKTNLNNMQQNISNDLHDDVGASLSSLQIYSALAKKIIDTQPEKAKELLEQIAENTQQAMEDMGDIVWAMKPAASSSKSLEAKIKDFGSDLLTVKDIACTYNIDPDAETALTNMAARRNILMIIKEAMNNIAKYSRATEATVTVQLTKSDLHLNITDNGAGFDMANYQPGNGLVNMNNRAQQLGGTYQLETNISKGTCITCSFPITNISDRR